jgi:hypothetical protein
MRCDAVRCGGGERARARVYAIANIGGDRERKRGRERERMVQWAPDLYSLLLLLVLHHLAGPGHARGQYGFAVQGHKES